LIFQCTIEDACSDWVKDKVYENKKHKSYVHQNARDTAREIVNEWKKPNGNRMALLASQMQSGKTSVMRHIAYLLNVKKERNKLKLQEDSVYCISGVYLKCWHCLC
jgi:hypothetical protein